MSYVTLIEQYVIPFFKAPGSYIEIGCWDGQHISQSVQLEHSGWKGVCVDPFPRNFNNRNCRLIEAAISKDGLPREFIKVTKDRRCGGDVSYFSGFKDNLRDHIELIEQHCDYEVIGVATRTFDSLPIETHTNFLSVDTEGSELEIFESIDFDRFSFDMIMFEHNGKDTGVRKLLETKGYELYQSLPIDDIFIKSK